MAEQDAAADELAGDDPDARETIATSASDVAQVGSAIREDDAEWQPNITLDLGDGLRWRPDLAKPDAAVLHVHLADRLRGYVSERLRAAASAGLEAHVALPIEALYDESLLIELASIEAQVHVLSGYATAERGDSVLGALAGGRAHRHPAIIVSESARTELGQIGWNWCRNGGTNHQKGRRLEGLLSFLLSQIDGLEVWERNLRVETEELDIVVIQRTTSGSRCWALPATPFILVECKNWSDPVGQPQVSNLRVKMQGRRGTVRIGLLVGASGFTTDAGGQEQRFASDQLTIALVGPGQLDEWIAAADGDDALERIIGRAMLR